jgi:phosphoribosyl 1,2-cyclic phosphate phosphodiesterase
MLDGQRIVYAPCDIKPFPEDRPEVHDADLLVIQPGIFETGLRHGFKYPENHISRKTLYTFEQTLALAHQIGAKQTVFTHLEEYWHRSYDDYLQLELEVPGIRFAYDGINIHSGD